jgi:hypothetical protein
MEVRDADSVRTGRDETIARLGGLDVLINTAGIGMRTVNPDFLTTLGHSARSRSLWPVPCRAESLSRIMAADLAATTVRTRGCNRDRNGPDEFTDTSALLPPDVMGAPVRWLCSPAADAVHDERIVATDFEEWLARWLRPMMLIWTCGIAVRSDHHVAGVRP